MFHKLIAIMVAVSIICIPTSAYADDAPLEGRVTSLSLGEAAPYEGILLDGVAASKMIVDKKLNSDILNGITNSGIEITYKIEWIN